MKPIRVFLLALTISLTARAQVDRVTLQSGSDVPGKVTGIHREGVVVTSADGEELVSWGRLAYVTSGAPVAVDFGGGNRAVGLVVSYELGTRIGIDTDVLGVLRIPIETLAARPEPEAVASAAPEGPATLLKPHDWKGGASLFSSITRGNAEVFDLAFEVKAARQGGRDRFELGAFAVRGVSDGRTNKNSQRAQGLWRHYYEEDFYSYASLEIGRDTVQEVSLRMLANIGAGVVLWKESDDESLAFEGGIGYRYESFAEEEETRNDATIRAALLYEDVFFEKGKYDQLLEVIVPVNEPGALLGRFEAGFSLPIAESWNLRNSIRLTYRGATPEGTKAFDLFLGVGVEYSF